MGQLLAWTPTCQNWTWIAGSLKKVHRSYLQYIYCSPTLQSRVLKLYQKFQPRELFHAISYKYVFDSSPETFLKSSAKLCWQSSALVIILGNNTFGNPIYNSLTKLAILPDYKRPEILCLALQARRKVQKLDFQSEFSMSKIIPISLIFFPLKNNRLDVCFLLR